ncbi:MAG: hypothetical protein HRT98_00140 [Mycoplasmatales bacterium]|nr:hypothetical protein [Mycoplasmatales bacterium]
MNAKKITLGAFASTIAIMPIVAISCGNSQKSEAERKAKEARKKMDEIQKEDVKLIKEIFPAKRQRIIGSTAAPYGAEWFAKMINGQHILTTKKMGTDFVQFYKRPVPKYPKELLDRPLTTVEQKIKLIEIYWSPFKKLMPKLKGSVVSSVRARSDGANGLVFVDFGITTKGATKEYKETHSLFYCTADKILQERWKTILSGH